MVTLAPPPLRPSAPSRATAARKTSALLPPHWTRRFTRSIYFLGAVLFHLLLFVALATLVIFRPPPAPPGDFRPIHLPPPVPPPVQPPADASLRVPTAVVTPPASVISVIKPPTPNFNFVPGEIIKPDMSPSLSTSPVKPRGDLHEHLDRIRDMEIKSWHRPAGNIIAAQDDIRNVVADFPIYIASYADGDWDCNTYHATGPITAGSMPDLMAKITEWSHGNLKGHVEPMPLAIGGPDLLAKMPPFIFFTGHKDFVLTEQEVQNLRDYLQDGGAIWGDNALAGKGSRFDVAFKREMRRVLPDLDKTWQEMPISADVFTKSWFPIGQLPRGMNYYDEPIQHIDIDGKLAIIYTPNDYSDLLDMVIEPGDAQMGPAYIQPAQPLFTNGAFLWNPVFFRDFTLQSSLDAHRLGMNILASLLVRFDKELLLAP